MNYLPVRLGTLRPGQALSFDLYIQVGKKHIHYIRTSEFFEATRIETLKGKGVKKLFIRPEEEPSYLKYLETGLDELKNGDQPLSEKGTVARDSMITEAEHIDRNLETEQGFKSAQNRVEKIVSFLASDKGALNSILTSAGVSGDSYQHSANVSTLSSSLALRLGVTNSREVFELALAGLLHDIGKRKLGIDFNLARENMTPAELKLYRKHPQEGVDLLAGKRYVTPGILRLVLEHEERGEGEGFPEKKNIESLHITSQVLCLCNEFDRLSAVRKIPPTDLIKLFFQEMGHLYNLEHITMLGQVIEGK